MALLGILGISEGLEILLLLLVLLLLALFVTRRILFSLRLRRVREENMELAHHMKKKLKSAKLKSLDDAFDEQEDEMFGPSVKAKVPVTPASYEARFSKTRRKAARKRAKKAPARKPARPRKVRKR